MHANSISALLSIATVVLAGPGTATRSGSGGYCPSNPTVTVTSPVYSIQTVTITSGTASTSYVFLSGSPAPTTGATIAVVASALSSSLTHLPKRNYPAPWWSWWWPIWGSGRHHPPPPPASSSCPNTSSTSQAATTSRSATSTASCPPTSTITVTATSTSVSTTTTAVTPPASTRTAYPCADMVDYKGPAYGDASGTGKLGLANDLYDLDTPEGASPEACCNTCFFELANCVQAYWYSYEGCVVSQATATNGTGTGMHVSMQCPFGAFQNLTYGPDTMPAFRSTGNIAGPCGVKYTNF